MIDGIEKLSDDLLVLEAMVEEMSAYLSSDVLFWPMLDARYPRLTPGAYLLRQHRLLALSNMLTEAEWRQLQESVAQFDAITADRVVRFEEKSTQDLEARLREWHEHLDDFQEHETVPLAHYAAAVQVRAIVAALVHKLGKRPFRLDAGVHQQIHVLDGALLALWQFGQFVWPPEWVPAYPRQEYWWLYGQAQGQGERQSLAHTQTERGQKKQEAEK